MNPSTQDEIKGTVHEVKGKVKETAGKVTNSSNLEAEGNAEKNTGKVQKKVGQIEKVFEKKLAEALPGACSCVWEADAPRFSDVSLALGVFDWGGRHALAPRTASLLPPPINGAFCALKIYA